MRAIGRAVFVLAIVAALCGCEKEQREKTYQKVRGPAVAGMFYPRHEQDLTKALDEHLSDARPPAIENLRGLVCPHAGYRFSGKTAAIGYKLLEKRDVKTAIVMAPSHYASFQGASIPDVEAYETPLGMIPLSPKAAELAKRKPFVVHPDCEVRRPPWWKQAPKELPPFGEDTPHSWEHSLEVQLPFLQRTLGDFHLVPIVFGQDVDAEAAARTLVKFLDEKTILVASSDLSHYYPYQIAERVDKTCVEAILDLKTAAMARQEACGKLPILTLMHIARLKGWKTRLLDYRHSGDVTGDLSQGVVGYAAIAFYEPAGPTEEAADQKEEEPFSATQRKFLLELARKTVEAAVNGETLPKLDQDGLPRKLTEEKGCFVTLNKNGQLRGCIGSIFPQEALCQAVIRRAQDAALNDRRFPDIEADELDQIEIEISVLTVPKLLEFQSPEELLQQLRPNRDGVVLRVSYKEATFLPQVWESLPEKEQFLSRLSLKAGLAADAWKSDRAVVLVYQAEVFKESEM